MKLYSYFRSSAAYRVRIALNYKQLPFEIIPVHLLKSGGEQYFPAYVANNPQGLVPTLCVDDLPLNQSLAILEYLEEQYPAPALLPSIALARAQVRAMALHIACEMHPINNLRVLKYLTQDLNLAEADKTRWYHHWVAQGFAAFEQRLEKNAGQYCFQDQFTFADICLIPQVYNALRFNCDLTLYPLVMGIYERCLQLPAVQAAQPEQQIDAE